MGILKGPRAKLERAQSQAEALQAEIATVLNPKPDAAPVKFRSYRQPRTPGQSPIWQITVIAPDMPTMPDDFGMRVGEALHNFRGALDHSIWRLVNPRKQKLTVRQQKRVQFPMAKTRRSYWNQVNDRLPGTTQDIRTLIECYQPYRRIHRGYFMRYLRDLTDLDKHRTILIAPTYSGEWDVELIWTEGCWQIDQVVHVKAGQQIKPDTKIGTLWLGCPEGVEPEMTVEGTLYYGAAFSTSILRPWAGRIPIAVTLALKGISDTCEEILGKLEAHL